MTRVTVPVDADAAGPEAVARGAGAARRYVPRAFAGVDAEALVGGQTADEIDFAAHR